MALKWGLWPVSSSGRKVIHQIAQKLHHSMSFSVLGSQGFSKVAIPRFSLNQKEPRRIATVQKPDRVSRACLNCRARKVKCNGATPTCSYCRKNAASCTYPSSRKDRLKRATSHNQDMIALLRELRGQVSVGDQSKIDSLLAAVMEDVEDAADNVQKPPVKKEEQEKDGRGEENVGAEVGGSGDLDLVDEYLL